MTELQLGHPERYVWAGSYYANVIARLVNGSVGFVVAPLFASEDEHDPPPDATPYTAEEVQALDEAEQLLVPTERMCPACLLERQGYLANQSPLGGSYFVCLSCQRWSDIEAPALPLGPRLRPSSLAE